LSDDETRTTASEFIIFAGIIWLSIGFRALNEQESNLGVFVPIGWLCIFIGMLLSLKAEKEKESFRRNQK